MGTITPVTVFLDSGSVACWITERLSRRLGLQRYKASHLTKLTGIGDGGHSITHNAIVHLYFCTTPGCHISPSAVPGISGRVSVACGILPNHVFPAEITLGREFLTATRTVYNSDKSVTLLSFEPPVTLAPLNSSQATRSCSDSPVMNTNNYLLDSDDGEIHAHYPSNFFERD